MGGLLSCLSTEVVCCFGSCAASLLGSIVSSTLSHASRFGHLLIYFVTFGIAIYIGANYTDQIKRINDYSSLTNVRVHLTSGCHVDYVDECIYQQLIYRASCSLVVLFVMLAVLTRYFEYVDRNMWLIKFILSLGLFSSLCLLDNEWFSIWAEVTRVSSIVWLLVQGLLVLDFGHDVHDMLTSDDDDMSMTSKAVYLGTSAAALTANVAAVLYLIHNNINNCELNTGFVIVTLCFGLLATVFSLMDCVGKGILTPLLMTVYAFFLCWYSLLSSPDVSCQPHAFYEDSKSTTPNVVIISAVSVGALIYCVVHGTCILNVFDPEAEGVITSYSNKGESASVELRKILTGSLDAGEGDEEGYSRGDAHEEDDHRAGRSPSSHERVLFHCLLASASCYGAMVLTNWGTGDGSPVGSDLRRGAESMWIKIACQWVFLLCYCRALHVAYLDNTDDQ